MKKIYLLITVLFFCTKLTYAQDPYLGEIRIFAGNYAPPGWAICDGRTLQISDNDALYTLLGTTYGGDGVTNFGLPDLRGRVATGASSNSALGTKAGVEYVTLTQANLPSHTHTASIKVSSAKATSHVPTANASIASPSITVNNITRDILGYNEKTPNAALAPVTSTPAGNSLPINVMQPYTVVNYIIALYGIYPIRN
ncbi:phage tail protein [Flavobacterium anhuiense]|uniref:phage tail protein n=1 Tax=Flavobacterium anhuiense TaxID=459526 RepID=UPI003D9871D4